MDHPHDELFKTVFADPAQAGPLLRLALAGGLGGALDLANITAATTELPDAEVGQVRLDLRFDVPPGAGCGAVRIHVEHKSEDDPGTPVQVLRYHAVDWQLCMAAGERTLPRIVAVVVHHGRKPWATPRSLAELLGPDTAGMPPQPQIEFVLLDLARCSEQDILAMPLPALGMLCFLYLRCLRWLDADDADAALERWAAVCRAAAATSPGAAFEVFHAYALEVTDLSRERLAKRMASILGPDARNAVMSTADKLRAEGRRLGRTEGRIEGRAEILFRLLQQRFGSAAENTAARLRTASSEQLDRWALRILDARTLDDVFAGG